MKVRLEGSLNNVALLMIVPLSTEFICKFLILTSINGNYGGEFVRMYFTRVYLQVPEIYLRIFVDYLQVSRLYLQILVDYLQVHFLLSNFV